MSNFNEANELASELVFGRTYQGEEPTLRPERLVFVNGESTAVVWREEESEAEWANVASVIQNLLNHGYRLGCDMDISWNGRYDTDGDPLPGGLGNYLPCRKPVAVSVDGRHLCNKHSLAEYPDRVRLVVLEAPGSVEEL